MLVCYDCFVGTRRLRTCSMQAMKAVLHSSTLLHIIAAAHSLSCRFGGNGSLGNRGAAVPSMFQQPFTGGMPQQRARQQVDAFQTPAQQLMGLQEQQEQTTDGLEQRAGVASDASPTLDQAGTSAAAATAAAANGTRQQSKSLTPGLRPNSRGASPAAASGSGAEDGGAEDAGGAGPARRRGTTLSSQRAAAQPYGAKSSFARNTPYSRWSNGKMGGAAAGAAGGVDAAENPLAKFSSRPPLPGFFPKPPPGAGRAPSSFRPMQQQSAGADVYLNAARSSRQGNSRPLTPWASVPGELQPVPKICLQCCAFCIPRHLFRHAVYIQAQYTGMLLQEWAAQHMPAGLHMRTVAQRTAAITKGQRSLRMLRGLSSCRLPWQCTAAAGAPCPALQQWCTHTPTTCGCRSWPAGQWSFPCGTGHPECNQCRQQGIPSTAADTGEYRKVLKRQPGWFMSLCLPSQPWNHPATSMFANRHADTRARCLRCAL